MARCRILGRLQVAEGREKKRDVCSFVDPISSTWPQTVFVLAINMGFAYVIGLLVLDISEHTH